MSDLETGSIDRLGPFLRGWGISVSPEEAARLDIFLDELMVWNRHINLTGVTSRKRIVDELLADSILPAPFLPDEGALLDVGSGAGFPAIPIKILKPRLTVRLMEPRAKKAHFLKQVIRLAGLHDIKVVQARLEEKKGPPPPRRYDVITSRAFVPLPGFLTLCAPYLAPGGLMAAFVGGRGESHIHESAAIMKQHKVLPFKRLAYTVHGKTIEREILILKKETGTTEGHG